MPRELRDKVYEELFYLDDFEIQQNERLKKLHTRILRVNREVYQEASETLYEKNAWVSLESTDWVMGSIDSGSINYNLGFPSYRQPVTTVMRHEDDRLSRSAVLTVRLLEDGDPNPQIIYRLVPLAAMPRFCRLLTQYFRVDHLLMTLKFNAGAKETHQRSLLGHIGQARGLGSVTVTDTEPPWAMVNTVLLMMHPYRNMVEILGTASAYHKRSEYELKQGQTFAARNIAQDGVDFVDWWLDAIRPGMERSAQIPDAEMDGLFEVRVDMGFSCAALCLRLGNVDLAQWTVRRVLEQLSSNQRLGQLHKACAHYHMAQTFETLGWKTAALYSYLQALRIRPGYDDADAAVDQMEQNIGFGTALEDAKVEHNINQVLNPFRYKPSHGAVVSDREYKRIFLEFDATAAEIHSLQRRTRMEVSRLYSRAPDVFLTMHRPISCT